MKLLSFFDKLKKKEEVKVNNKNNWVDFKEIKTKVNIKQILARYNLIESFTQKKDELVGPCPIHKGSNREQFHTNVVKNNYHCFGNCHGGGNIIDLVSNLENVDIRTAALLIQNWFLDGPEVLTRRNREEDRKVKEQPKTAFEKPAKEEESVAANDATQKANPPLKFVLKNLNPDHPYLLDRGFEKEVIEAFGIGYCEKGMMAGRIAIPIHNTEGQVVAYAGRWPGDPPEGEPKYKLPAGFHKSLELFNFHRAKELAREHGLILVEGFFDCLQVYSAGFQNVVSLLGSKMGREQERLILETVGPSGKVSLMFDEDAAGWACRDEVLDRLASEVYVKIIRLGDEGLQPDSLSKEEIKKLLGKE